MASLAELTERTLAAARERRWPAYRQRFAALREGLIARAGEDVELRERLDLLNAAAPEHDPEGCVGELEALARLVGASPAGLLEWDSDEEGALDLRGLAPPEPIVRIFEALERAPQSPLRAILPHEPAPLYGLLRERGFACRGAPRADGGFEVLIEPA